VIRAATQADAEAIADVEARAWRWAYSDFIDPEDMRDPYTRRAPWSEYIAAGGVHVFDQDGVVAGYAVVRGDELSGLYVDPSAQGAGVGGQLLRDAEERLRAAGTTRAFLLVYADNAHGRAFYERNGWERVGELLGAGEWRAPGYRYEKALA
jgi:ribosomal protein S18 acetylase RimI-like enzyme